MLSPMGRLPRRPDQASDRTGDRRSYTTTRGTAARCGRLRSSRCGTADLMIERTDSLRWIGDASPTSGCRHGCHVRVRRVRTTARLPSAGI